MRGASERGAAQLDFVAAIGEPRCYVEYPVSDGQTEGVPIGADLHQLVRDVDRRTSRDGEAFEHRESFLEVIPDPALVWKGVDAGVFDCEVPSNSLNL
jgi:hypothetical protein